MSGKKDQTEILDLEKAILKTIVSVKHVLDEANMPCVGFSLVFLDHLGEENEYFFQTRLLGSDSHADPEDATRKNIRLVFEFMAEGIKRIMNGQFNEDNEVNEFTVTGSFH